ncbi:MAG: hypothetical protein II975_07880 [Bacteroidales bacterium]|nr:hypothetical protein [Bacteroidales bacterium]
MKPLLYEYADDENGCLTHIDNAIVGRQYSCIACGEPLLIKASKSQKKRKHFSHKSNVFCEGESYIHKLYKRLIREKFYREDTFVVKYYVSQICQNTEKCEIKRFLKQKKCNTIYMRQLDLKKEYDICKEEFMYNGFIGDLVLMNSKNPNKEPLFIEVDHTHSCDEMKISSGIRIIELKAFEEQNVHIVFIESLHPQDIVGMNFHYGNPYSSNLPDVRFYNFNRESYPSLGVYSFIKKNNMLYEMQFKSGYTCQKQPTRNTDAAFEVAIADDIVNSNRTSDYIASIIALAIKNGCAVRDCRVCQSHRYNKIFHKECPLIAENGYATAIQCQRYSFNNLDIQRMANVLRGIPHSEWLNV